MGEWQSLRIKQLGHAENLIVSNKVGDLKEPSVTPTTFKDVLEHNQVTQFPHLQLCNYRGYLPCADFGTLCKICVSGTVGGPLLTPKSPTCAYIHKPKTKVVETVLVILV